MEKEKWAFWVEKLHAWRLNQVAAGIIEGLGPFHLLSAQFLYVSQPIWETFLSPHQGTVLADMLEDPAATQRFIDALRDNNYRQPSGGRQR